MVWTCLNAPIVILNYTRRMLKREILVFVATTANTNGIDGLKINLLKSRSRDSASQSDASRVPFLL
jgi:hypothetical protein